MRLACQEQLIPGDTLAEKWSFISAAGFDGIELLGRGDLAFERRLPELRAAPRGRGGALKRLRRDGSLHRRLRRRPAA